MSLISDNVTRYGNFGPSLYLLMPLAYVGLFVGVHTANWHLRTGSIKKMAPIFSAFDHPTYEKLISDPLIGSFSTATASVAHVFPRSICG